MTNETKLFQISNFKSGDPGSSFPDGVYGLHIDGELFVEHDMLHCLLAARHEGASTVTLVGLFDDGSVDVKVDIRETLRNMGF